MENKANHLSKLHMEVPFEIKSVAADGSFEGYASVFHVVDSQYDRVHPGAFKGSITKRVKPVQLLWQHQWDKPIGVITSIFENARGLYVKGKLLLDLAQAREAYSLLKSGIVRGLSIGYSVKRARRNPETGVRELLDLQLWEISLVTQPANEAAQVVAVKGSAADDSLLTLREAIGVAGVVLYEAIGSPGNATSSRPL